jgi:hypothetical protein
MPATLIEPKAGVSFALLRKIETLQEDTKATVHALVNYLNKSNSSEVSVC